MTPAAWLEAVRGEGGPLTLSLLALAAACLISADIGALWAGRAAAIPSGLRARLDAFDPLALLRGEEAIAPEARREAASAFVLRADGPASRERATRCLADAIYYEAATEPLEGRRAVAQVVLNRVRDPRFPKSICGVVYEGWASNAGCQFSFACDGALNHPPSPAAYRSAMAIAAEALSGRVEPRAGWATHYHTTRVAPDWRGLVRVGQIGSQIFYRWAGAQGRSGAFNGRYAGVEYPPSVEQLLARRHGRAMSPQPGPDALPTTLAANPDAYVNGRPLRTPAQIEQMNKLLDERRPAAGAGAG